jgi:hypothetical protein
MICSHSQCTGIHNRNQPWAVVCPRTKEAGLAIERRRYANQTWLEHHAKQLKTRRIKALKRMKERADGR